MKTDATIEVYCDSPDCKESTTVSLTVTAGGYDERNVDDELEQLGWLVTEDGEFCESCAADKQQVEQES